MDMENLQPIIKITLLRPMMMVVILILYRFEALIPKQTKMGNETYSLTVLDN